MISSLQELVSPLTEAAFFDLLRARAFIKFERGSTQNRFENLLSWNMLRDLIESGAFPARKLRVTSKTERVLPLFYTENEKINSENLAKLLHQGASLILVPLNPYVPALDALCSDIRMHTGEKIKAGAIVTSGKGGALKYHYDKEDLILVQIEGTKRWRIYGPPFLNPVEDPGEFSEPPGNLIFDDIMRPGDFLFLPAGFYHHCDNGPDLSLHLAIMLEPPTGYHTVKTLLPQLIEEDLFRVPLSRVGDAASRIALEAAIKSRLLEKMEQILLFESTVSAGASTSGGPLTLER